MSQRSLVIEADVTEGEVHIPNYGTFLKPTQNNLHLLTSGDSEVQFVIDEENPGLETLVCLPGQTIHVLNKLVYEKVLPSGMLKGALITSGAYAVTDDFLFTSIVNFEGNAVSIRRSNFHVMFDIYLSREIKKGRESKILAYGFLASKWLQEHGVAIFDGVWSADPTDLNAKLALYQGIEHEIGKNHQIIRACSKLDLSKEGGFLLDQGYRLMKRTGESYIQNPQTPIGRIEMAKVLHPDFDVSIIDRV